MTTSATLVVVEPTAYAATTLSYPTTPSVVRGLVYDAERRALLVVTDAGIGSIVRFPYTGSAWGAPTEVAAGLRDVAISVKGTPLLGITSTAIVPVDPVTLAVGTAVAAPSMTPDSFLKNIVVGNDNLALITSGLNASSPTTNTYVYSPTNNAVGSVGENFDNATPAMTANGVFAYLIQGSASLADDVPARRYVTGATQLANSTLRARQNNVPPVVSRNGHRLVLRGTRVYDGNEALLGTLPETTVAIALKPDGSRAYTYDPTVGGIRVFDISVNRSGAAYDVLGSVVPTAGDPGSNPRMIISPDGRTLFLAGRAQVVVQPTPAL
jgi:hypothetical protein